MQIPWQSLQGFSGATAVGALTFIGLVLIANAFAPNLFPAIDFYARTSTWAIVVAIPVLSLAYLLGLVSIGIAEAALIWFSLLDENLLVNDPIKVSSCGEFVASKFHQLRQEAEILAGSSISLVLLSFGAALSAWAVGGWRRFLIAITVFALLLAICCIMLSISRNKTAKKLAIAAELQD